MPLPSPVLATVLSSAPTPSSVTPRKLKRHFGTDITGSTNNSPAIHHSCDFATMIKRVKEYDEQLYGDKQAWLDRPPRHAVRDHRQVQGEAEAAG